MGVSVSTQAVSFGNFLGIKAGECADVTALEDLTICYVGWRTVYWKKTSLKFYPCRTLMLIVLFCISVLQ